MTDLLTKSDYSSGLDPFYFNFLFSNVFPARMLRYADV